MPDGVARGGPGRGAVRARPAAPTGNPHLAATHDPGGRLVDAGAVVVGQPDLQELTDALRDRTGRLRLPDPPVTRVRPGTLAAAVTVTPVELGRLLRSTSEVPELVWSRAGSEIAVVIGKLGATTAEGGLVVTVPVQTEQTGAVDIQVPLAVGTTDRDAGLLASTSSQPLGPAVIVDRWGEAIVALVWQSVLQVAIALAARAGNDARGDPLVPASLRSGGDGFTVVPLARHRKVV